MGNIVQWYEQLNQTSTMFSKARKKWIKGPNLPVGLKFTNACGLALNRSKVLFVGVSRLPFDLIPSNYITLTYDIEDKIWQFQGELSGQSDKTLLYYTSCAVNFEKNGERRSFNIIERNTIIVLIIAFI